MEVFINGLPRSIEGNVTASKPQTLEESINIARRLIDQIIKRDFVQETNDRKRKLEDKGNIINNNNYQNNYNNRNNHYHQQQNRKQEAFKTYTTTNGYTGNRPLCERCTLHHIVIPQISFRCYIVKMGVLQIGISAMVIENKVVIRMMSSPNHYTSDIEDAFSFMNILNYTLVLPDYFPASAGSRSFNSSENSNDNMIPPVFSSFYNNTYLKDEQEIYAKELPISSPDPITPPAILTPSSVLPPSASESGVASRIL
ncbi:hypothetical protein Tco_1304368 [Tanacetum coccineum]